MAHMAVKKARHQGHIPKVFYRRGSVRIFQRVPCSNLCDAVTTHYNGTILDNICLTGGKHASGSNGD